MLLRDFIRGLILLPVAALLVLILFPFMAAAWILSFIPFIGVNFFVKALLVMSPFIGALQYCGLAVQGLFTEELSWSGKTLQIKRLCRKTEYIQASNIKEVVERFTPPFPVFYLIFTNTEERKLSLLSNIRHVFSWAKHNNIPVITRSSDQTNGSAKL